MSYEFVPGMSYRMPTHFGPSLGPRQRPGGGFHPLDEGNRSTSIWLRTAAQHDEIAQLLPEGFEPASQPDLLVDCRKLENIGWLAGRGYSLITITTAVRWLGGAEPVDGRFKLILWENMADPIITGREDLGYPKVYADIPEFKISDTDASAEGLWDGFKFIELSVNGLDKNNPAAPPSGPSYHLAYFPRIGTVGEHALVQTILTPPGQGAQRITNRAGGTGSLRFNAGSWQQLPTLQGIIDKLASLTLGPVLGAGLTETAGYSDLRYQEIITE